MVQFPVLLTILTGKDKGQQMMVDHINDIPLGVDFKILKTNFHLDNCEG